MFSILLDNYLIQRAGARRVPSVNGELPRYRYSDLFEVETNKHDEWFLFDRHGSLKASGKGPMRLAEARKNLADLERTRQLREAMEESARAAQVKSAKALARAEREINTLRKGIEKATGEPLEVELTGGAITILKNYTIKIWYDMGTFEIGIAGSTGGYRKFQAAKEWLAERGYWEQ